VPSSWSATPFAVQVSPFFTKTNVTGLTGSVQLYVPEHWSRSGAAGAVDVAHAVVTMAQRMTARRVFMMPPIDSMTPSVAKKQRVR
jgi:hypothetical protein